MMTPPLVILVILCQMLVSCRCHICTTLNSPYIVGHGNLLGPTLMLIMRINVGHVIFDPTLNLWQNISMDHTKYVLRKLMRVIIYFALLLSKTSIQCVNWKSS